MDWRRFFTGVVIVFLTFVFVYIGGFVFSLIIAFVSVLALWEFYKLFFEDVINFSSYLLWISGLFYAIMIILSAYILGFLFVPLLLSCNFVSASTILICGFKYNPNIFENFNKQVIGLLYIPISLSILVVMRNSEDGLLWSTLTMSVVAAGDTGAYYFGNFFGRHKLCPQISPKKTIEGSIGGLFCSIFLVLAFKFYLFLTIPVFYCIIFACVVGVVGQLGDLFASILKRLVGAKDYGRLLPGHGGILDRIDGLLLALPIAYLLQMCVFWLF